MEILTCEQESARAGFGEAAIGRGRGARNGELGARCTDIDCAVGGGGEREVAVGRAVAACVEEGAAAEHEVGCGVGGVSQSPYHTAIGDGRNAQGTGIDGGCSRVGVRTRESESAIAVFAQASRAAKDAAERGAGVIPAGSEGEGAERDVTGAVDRSDHFVRPDVELGSAGNAHRTGINNGVTPIGFESPSVDGGRAVVGVRAAENHGAATVLCEAEGRARDNAAHREVAGSHCDRARGVHGHGACAHIQVVTASEGEVSIPVERVVVGDGFCAAAGVVECAAFDGECAGAERCGIVERERTRVNGRGTAVGIRPTEDQRATGVLGEGAGARDDTR